MNIPVFIKTDLFPACITEILYLEMACSYKLYFIIDKIKRIEHILMNESEFALNYSSQL